jgi:diguanylate cyclase (GGDEF)-like protein
VLRALRRPLERDELTRLPARAGFRADIAPLFAAPQRGPIGLVIFGLDHLMSVNDTYGRTVGDAVLQAAAERAGAEARQTGVTIGRWGGDELVTASSLPAIEPVPALHGFAESVRAAVASPIPLDERQVMVTTSAGGAVCRCGSCAFADLFRRADRQLVKAKESGRNQVLVADCTPKARPQPTRPLVTTVIQRHT